MPLSSGEIAIDVGRAAPITVNRYMIAYGSQRQLVLYWYQSRDRAVASEYKAKFWVMADAIRLNRTDTALVRVVVPVRESRRSASPGDRHRLREIVLFDLAQLPAQLNWLEVCISNSSI